jgi:basic membrane lipoprotein Med (substrate-binding protein (PBP1-ABC) superfamily)
VLEGTWRAQPVWGGVKDGRVRLSALRADLPAGLRVLVESRRQAIEAGRFRPFSAPLADDEGRVRLAQGTRRRRRDRFDGLVRARRRGQGAQALRRRVKMG